MKWNRTAIISWIAAQDNTLDKFIMILNKDFIETDEQLVFAVVDQCREADKVLCFLRYRKIDGQYQKLATEQANDLLKRHFPQYLHHSQRLDANLHALPVADIAIHHQPRKRLQSLLSISSHDEVVKDLQALIYLLQVEKLDCSVIGVTGSVLIGAQTATSDIDLVFYDRAHFFKCRNIIKKLQADNKLGALTEQDWFNSYQRRGCDLSFAEYQWHEQRKYNKALINNRKFDIALHNSHADDKSETFHKIGMLQFTTHVTDARYSYDYPAVYQLADNNIASCICFSATYTGQAETGEQVMISGLLESNRVGNKRVVVGSSREAAGEYIKVLR